MVATTRKKTPEQVAFGDWLKARRYELGISSADEAGRIAGLGNGSWRALEAPGGTWHEPTPGTIKSIARALDCSAEEVARRAGVRLSLIIGDPPVQALASSTVSLDILGDIINNLKEIREEIAGISDRIDRLEPPVRPRPRGRKPAS